MKHLTPQQRAIIIRTFYQNESSIVNTRKKLRDFFGAHNVPSKPTIQRVINNFETRYTLQDLRKSGRTRTARTPQNINAIKESVDENPKISVRCRAKEISVSPTTTWKILRKDLHYYPYKIKLIQRVQKNDHKHRRKRNGKRLSYTFRGLVVPVHTPFYEDGSLNLTVIPEYAKYLASKKIPGILVNGTTGEGMSMSVAERKLVAEAWSNEIKTTCQHLIIQVGGAPLPDVIELARHAESLHANAILCLPDLYWKPTTPQQLIKYLKIVGNAAPTTPLLYYHIPMFTNVNIHMGEFLESIGDKIPSFVGIKFTSANLEEGVQALRADGYKYVIFLGNDQIINAAYVSGIDSFMLASINIYPDVVQNLVAASKSKNIIEAKNMQENLSRAINNITKHGDFVPTMKLALAILTNINIGSSRLPLKIISAKVKDIMIKELTKLDS